MFDDPGGSLAQNPIDVRLVQNNVYFNKPIRVPIVIAGAGSARDASLHLKFPYSHIPESNLALSIALAAAGRRRAERAARTFPRIRNRQTSQARQCRPNAGPQPRPL